MDQQVEKKSALQEKLYSGETTCVELTQSYLDNCRKHESLNAFVEVFEQEALERAKFVDEKIKNGSAGKLAGLVIGIKDVLSFANHKLTCSSKILENFEAQFSATAVQRLIEEDAIIIGRQNCDEFAMGSSNETSFYGPVQNAADTNRVSGGSSGGSAVAVQANMCSLSLGSDTGGSVRQPAGFCGIYGLKPTYSRISRHGLVAYASSFDCIGLLSKNLEDIAGVLEVVAGHDDYDSTCSTKTVPNYTEFVGRPFEKKKKFGIIKETIENEALQGEVKENTEKVLNLLREEGHEVVELDFPLLEYILPTYYILTTAEASSNLSRYDGVRYGYRSPNSATLKEMYENTRSEGFGDEVKRRILLGTLVLSSDYHDAYFTKAQRVRQLIKEASVQMLKQCDFLLMPTTPYTAFKRGELINDPIQMYLGDLFTVQANVAGIPALAVPNGKDKNGMPVGIQIAGNYFHEADLLQAGSYLSELISR